MTNINKTLEHVVKDTLAAIENGKTQIFEISEMARKECQRVKKELEELRILSAQIITQVDELETHSKAARLRLMEVDQNFQKYSEEIIKSAYEQANKLQIKLIQMREREMQARSKRDELERSLRNLEETVVKAEALVSQVGVVLDFIGGSLKEVNTRLEDLEQRQQTGVLVIKAQEEERKRIAREIHDGPAQAMANVVLRVEFCEKLLDFEPSKVKAELTSLKHMVRLTLQDVRKIIFDLRPMALDDLGLVPALKRYLTDYKEKYNLNANFVLYGKERRIKPTIEVGLFRVIQEALNNVWKHAKATNVTVRMELSEMQAVAMIKDDGKGFDLQKALSQTARESLGMTSMRERVELLAGTLQIKSAEGKGTEVIVKVPLETE